MEREIKFRAWNNGMYYDVVLCNGLWTDNMREDRWHSGDIMQYTGIKDKNGKEIYEGDVVKMTTPDNEDFGPDEVLTGAVIWRSHKWKFDSGVKKALGQRDWSDYASLSAQVELMTEFEIIGNIHESPELLKTKPCN